MKALKPLKIGNITLSAPVVLAPMAGITNAAFRRLCREHGGGLFVSEMTTSRALVERTPESLRMVTFDEDESPRSIQLYGVDPATVAAAVRMVVEEDRADHIDMNFGCPVAKVTRKGGGAALPWKASLFRQIVEGAVREAARANIPVTVKMRKGIDDDHLTFLEAGRVAQDVGVAAVSLHGRTASQYYSGKADWNAIGQLKEAVTEVPVLGNGDIWSGDDAVAMIEQTGCDGVVVGRGCLGRPWLFADLEAALSGSDERARPTLGEVAKTLQRHTALLGEHFGDENRGCREIRKHIAWYFKGYSVPRELRRTLAMVSTADELAEKLSQLDHDQPYPPEGAEGPRGRQGTPTRVSLPDGWLKDQEVSQEWERKIREAELSVSGG